MNKEMKLGIYNFIKEVNMDLRVKFQEYDIECDIYDEIIYIGATFDKQIDKYFQEFVEQLEPKCKNINPFLLSILHEIGHIETWTEEDLEEKHFLYNMLQMNYKDSDIKEYNNMYFRIPLEQNATEWGINYALSHLDLMKKYNWLHN